MILAIEIIAAILFLVEAKLEQFVIAMKSEQTPNYPINNRKEHAWSLVWAAILCGSLCLVSGVWFLLPSLVLSRRLFFDYFLKIFRGRSLAVIEGNGWFDNASRKILGKKGGIQELLLVLVLKGGYLFFINKIFAK